MIAIMIPNNSGYYIIRLKCNVLFYLIIIVFIGLTTFFESLEFYLKIFRIMDIHPHLQSLMSDNLASNKRLFTLLERNGFSDLYQKAFLKPFQIKLKAQGSTKIPNGLSILKKESIFFNKYEEHDIPTLSSPERLPQPYWYKYIKSNMMDNMISLKKMEENIEFAICITMKSEGKDEVESTISSIKKALTELIKYRVSPQKIIIVLVVDGIMNIHPTMFSLLQALQKESNIFFEDSSHASFLESDFEQDLIDYSLVMNLNQILFDPYELDEMRKSRIVSRYKQFKEIEVLQSEIQKLLKNKEITYDDINNYEIFKNIFIDNAKKKMKWEYGLDDIGILEIQQKQLINSYSENTALLKNTLNEADKYCKQYRKSRLGTSLLSFYRTYIFTSTQHPSTFRNQNPEQIQSASSIVPTEVNQQDPFNPKTYPINLFAICKYQQSGKLSSHSWFLNGICHQLKPNFVLMMQAGSEIQKNGLVKIYHELKNNERLGGLCGYQQVSIKKELGQFDYCKGKIDCVSFVFHQLFKIQRAQKFNNHLTNLFKFSSQSFISKVEYLPGQICAINYQFLEAKQKKALLEYFTPLLEKQLQIQTKVVHESEFRVIARLLLPAFLYPLCSKSQSLSDQNLLSIMNINNQNQNRVITNLFRQHDIIVKMVPDLICSINPKVLLEDSCEKRKQQIQSLYSVTALDNSSNNTNYNDKVVRILNWIDQELMFIFPAVFFLALGLSLRVLTDQFVIKASSNIFTSSSQAQLRQLSYFGVNLIPFGFLVGLFGFAIYSIFFPLKYHRFTSYIYGFSTYLGVLTLFIFAILIYKTVKFFTEQFRQPYTISGFSEDNPLGLIPLLYIFFFVFIGIHILMFLLYQLIFCRFEMFFDLIRSFLSYLFYLPTNNCIFYLYGLCKLDQFSVEEHYEPQKYAQIKQAWKSIKILQVSKYLVWNTIVAAILIFFMEDLQVITYIILVLLILYCLTPALNFFIALIYFYREKLQSSCGNTKPLRKRSNFTKNDREILQKIGIFQGLCDEVKENLKKYGEDNQDLKKLLQINRISSIRIAEASYSFRKLRQKGKSNESFRIRKLLERK